MLLEIIVRIIVRILIKNKIPAQVLQMWAAPHAFFGVLKICSLVFLGYSFLRNIQEKNFSGLREGSVKELLKLPLNFLS